MNYTITCSYGSRLLGSSFLGSLFVNSSAVYFLLEVEVEFEDTLLLTISQYVLVSSTLVGLATRYYFLSVLLSEICGLISVRRHL
jgi:hypothetical protein